MVRRVVNQQVRVRVRPLRHHIALALSRRTVGGSVLLVLLLPGCKPPHEPRAICLRDCLLLVRRGFIQHIQPHLFVALRKWGRIWRDVTLVPHPPSLKLWCNTSTTFTGHRISRASMTDAPFSHTCQRCLRPTPRVSSLHMCGCPIRDLLCVSAP
eukprot:2480560-Prymnesium_polylepis.1